MKRRSTEKSGWVNFPINDPAWENTREGGMFVKLVVCDNRENDDAFGICCGAFVKDVLNESLVGDDQAPCPKASGPYDTVEAVLAEQDAIEAWHERHFPNINNSRMDGIDRYLSRDYLAVLVIGSTGWSGWNSEKGGYWQCTFDDLTEEGKVLYRQIAALYQGCDLHLLTFLDT